MNTKMDGSFRTSSRHRHDSFGSEDEISFLSHHDGRSSSGAASSRTRPEDREVINLLDETMQFVQEPPTLDSAFQTHHTPPPIPPPTTTRGTTADASLDVYDHPNDNDSGIRNMKRSIVDWTRAGIVFGLYLWGTTWVDWLREPLFEAKLLGVAALCYLATVPIESSRKSESLFIHIIFSRKTFWLLVYITVWVSFLLGISALVGAIYALFGFPTAMDELDDEQQLAKAAAKSSSIVLGSGGSSSTSNIVLPNNKNLETNNNESRQQQQLRARKLEFVPLSLDIKPDMDYPEDLASVRRRFKKQREEEELAKKKKDLAKKKEELLKKQREEEEAKKKRELAKKKEELLKKQREEEEAKKKELAKKKKELLKKQREEEEAMKKELAKKKQELLKKQREEEEAMKKELAAKKKEELLKKQREEEEAKNKQEQLARKKRQEEASSFFGILSTGSDGDERDATPSSPFFTMTQPVEPKNLLPTVEKDSKADPQPFSTSSKPSDDNKSFRMRIGGTSVSSPDRPKDSQHKKKEVPLPTTPTTTEETTTTSSAPILSTFGGSPPPSAPSSPKATTTATTSTAVSSSAPILSSFMTSSAVPKEQIVFEGERTHALNNFDSYDGVAMLPKSSLRKSSSSSSLRDKVRIGTAPRRNLRRPTGVGYPRRRNWFQTMAYHLATFFFGAADGFNPHQAMLDRVAATWYGPMWR